MRAELLCTWMSVRHSTRFCKVGCSWKVRSHGIQGELAGWIANRLHGRKQRVMVEGCFSDWRSVNSGVPQGLVPGLFVIYINDLDENIQGKISKFGDDTKLIDFADSEDGCERLQQDLDRLARWSEEKLMEFNTEKCEMLHFGTSNKGRTYTVNSRPLGSVVEQWDLGVQAHGSLKVESQVDNEDKNAFGTLAFISQSIEYRSWEVMLQLYKTSVRLHLEYCVQFWAPCYRKDIVKLERVQKRFMRMLPGLEGVIYRERLSRLRLYSLERRRLRGDLIEVYKIMRAIDLLLIGESRARGHRFKVKGKRFNRNLRGNKRWWVYGTSCQRRLLSLELSHCLRNMDRTGLEGYGPSAGRWD
ncbi:uncharacterized protein LOC129699607 [Leucoraja erinacea]|uniref:uncharacterized protein LOC129699607 n=1 Tax=Leucoraja erinaceus TaxID=7782 RepID=UPI0024554B9F|nr:uncharacterized protein LOC129699607 [Leucoraja erinacea]